MFFRRNKEYRDYSYFYEKVNPETQEVIDLAASLLTPEQLKTFEIPVIGEKSTFKSRMEARYGSMWPIFQLDRMEKIIREEITSYKHLFEKGIDFDFNRYFIEKLGFLFERKKGDHAKRVRRVMKKGGIPI